METELHSAFKKLLKRAPTKVQKAFSKRLELFRQDKFHPLLNNHVLTGEYKGLRSINVTGDWRALFSEHETEDGELIIFQLINTHSELYKK